MHKNRKTGKIISSLLTVLIAAACVIPFTGAGRVQAVVNQPDITITPIDDINCASYCVYDFTADEILMERQSHNRIYPASMTKILTLLVAAEHITDLDDTFEMINNHAHNDDNLIKDNFNHYFSVSKQSCSFQSIRLQMNGKNHYGDNYLQNFIDFIGDSKIITYNDEFNKSEKLEAFE